MNNSNPAGEPKSWICHVQSWSPNGDDTYTHSKKRYYKHLHEASGFIGNSAFTLYTHLDKTFVSYYLLLMRELRFRYIITFTGCLKRWFDIMSSGLCVLVEDKEHTSSCFLESPWQTTGNSQLLSCCLSDALRTFPGEVALTTALCANK